MAEPAVTLVRRFRAAPDRLFAAVTEPAALARWLGPAAFRCTEIEADPRPGGRFFFRMVSADDTVAATGRFREVVAPSRVVIDWRWTEGAIAAPGRDTVLTLTIAPDGEGSRLTLTHAGVAEVEGQMTHDRGWAESLDKLDTYLEDPP